MDRIIPRVPLNDYTPHLAEPNVLTISAVQADVDGDDLGTLEIAALQQRLEEAGDFAIVQLGAAFTTVTPLDGMEVLLGEAGLRNLDLDRNYLTPSAEAAGTGSVLHVVPGTLPPGDHVLEWSYAWNPPRDEDGAPAPDGVILAAARVCGQFVIRPEGLAALPESVDLRELESAGLADPTMRPELTREVEVPIGARSLLVEGPVESTFEIYLDGSLCPEGAVVRRDFRIPEFIGGSVPLTIRFTGSPAPITAMRFRG